MLSKSLELKGWPVRFRVTPLWNLTGDLGRHRSPEGISSVV